VVQTNDHIERGLRVRRAFHVHPYKRSHPLRMLHQAGHNALGNSHPKVHAHLRQLHADVCIQALFAYRV
jgi:hypothetical protein